VAHGWGMHFARPLRHARLVSVLLLAALVCGLSLSPAVAQENRYVPFDQNAPVGRVGLWVGQMGKGLAGVLQSVQVSLPSKGKVTVYNGGRETGIDLGSPAQFNVGIGFVYRLRLADMPEFPGIELYPTIEMIDRLHPPAGRAQDFPIPIRFTAEEIESAIDGRLVTKVVYVEQPQLAVTGDLTQAMLARFLPPDRNLLIEADRAGRPMILVRIGSRTPDDSQADAAFFLPPAPFRLAELHVRPSDADSGHTVVIDKATTFTPAVPRSEVEPTDAIRRATRRGLLGPTPPRPYFALEPPAPPWELYPDEYLLDGGDRGLPVHETPGHREGLDTEDAVAEYVDHSGNPHLLPTNRVAIYSPRFGFVGTKTGLEAGVTVSRAASAVDLTRGEGVRNRIGTVDQEQRMPSLSVRVRSRASGFDTEAGQMGVNQQTILSQNTELAGSLEGVQNQGAPEMRQSDRARIARERQAAIAWTRNEFPVIAASLEGAQQVVVKFVASELVGIEDRRKPGRLEIVKLADKQIAQPGEIVNFRIEYENIGDRELKDVRIIDNLTPRLEYVADSATSSRSAALSVTDNGEGSVILTWSLKEPLKGKTKGFVTFKSRVR
jgi:uncharacterized repeat protein (TIGR01451 family)